MSVSYIPDRTRQQLWGRAGGRCQYLGCNVQLYRDQLTNVEFNTSYVAHIVADKPTGPRGHETLSEQLKSEIRNLMLMCDVHHRLVDIEDVDGHSVEWLAEMKRLHESRVEIVTGISQDRQSHILQYGAKVGEHDSPLSYQNAAAAMLPDWYPASTNPISLGLKNSSFSDRETEYWNIETEHLRRQFERHVRPGLTSGDLQHISLFALAPIPLLVLLGQLLSDIPQVRVHQLHREPPDWIWRDDPPQFDFELLSEGNSESKKVALTLALSAEINSERITSVLGEGVAIYKITHDDPNNDFLKSETQLGRFRNVMRRALNQIKTAHGEDAELSLFPACPVSAAVEIGRVWMPKADLGFRIYDQNRLLGGFEPAITIGSED